MSFDIAKFLEEPPKLDPNNPAQFEGHYRDFVTYMRDFFNKQRQLGYGVSYDSQDRVHVPLAWLWLHS